MCSFMLPADMQPILIETSQIYIQVYLLSLMYERHHASLEPPLTGVGLPVTGVDAPLTACNWSIHILTPGQKAILVLYVSLERQTNCILLHVIDLS